MLQLQDWLVMLCNYGRKTAILSEFRRVPTSGQPKFWKAA